MTTDDHDQQPPAVAATGDFDQEAMQRLEFEIRRRQSLLWGGIAGALAAAVGAAVWGGIAYVGNVEIGWLAIGIGFLVGIAVLVAGRGVTPQFGVLGAGLALLGVLGGKYVAVVAFVAQESEMGMLETMGLLDAATLAEVFKMSFHPLDLLFYGLALWCGFKYSFRRIELAVAQRLGAESVAQ